MKQMMGINHGEVDENVHIEHGLSVIYLLECISAKKGAVRR
jgi:hypothetical protein